MNRLPNAAMPVPLPPLPVTPVSKPALQASQPPQPLVGQTAPQLAAHLPVGSAAAQLGGHLAVPRHRFGVSRSNSSSSNGSRQLNSVSSLSSIPETTPARSTAQLQVCVIPLWFSTTS